ncbi:hypothetical protein M408DRAFT_30331, partial [Serendipita vermifera MAFF 305830]
MWKPANAAVLPTLAQVLDTKKTIEDTELRLSEAFRLLKQTECLIASLQKDLTEQRAWISPERKLHSDILTTIFDICGAEDSDSLLNIARVSRKWRAIVLGTTRVWSYLRFHNHANTSAVQACFERSNPLPLH